MPRKVIDHTAEVLANTEEQGFTEITRLIQAARENTFRTVNTALIDLYWQSGQALSRRVQAAEWGEGVVDRLAAYLAQTQPGLRRIMRANLFRMRQFYDTSREDEKVCGRRHKELRNYTDKSALGSSFAEDTLPNQSLANDAK